MRILPGAPEPLVVAGVTMHVEERVGAARRSTADVVEVDGLFPHPQRCLRGELQVTRLAIRLVCRRPQVHVAGVAIAPTGHHSGVTLLCLRAARREPAPDEAATHWDSSIGELFEPSGERRGHREYAR